LSRARRPYKTLDGYVCALIYTDRQWRSFYTMLGREAELDTDPRLKSLSTRTTHVDAIYGEVEATLATRSTAEWLACLEDAGVDNWQGFSHAMDTRRQRRRASMGEPL
jgi:crotonobetainyl-CoA:carnitine CoA-transferase CaiB-like acyl-CoA transferase